jgi:hypothetical protein
MTPDQAQSATGTIEAYRLEVPQEQIDDLSDRLARTRWPDEIPGVGWTQGVPLEQLQDLAEYWRTTYDWRVWEADLNAVPPYTTTLDGATVHFLHVRSPEPNALPVVMTHGWPGSVVEFLNVIGPLTDPRAHGGDPSDALDLVLPHIPGYPGPARTSAGASPESLGAWAELMGRLGYSRYGAQGGD